MYVIQQLSSFNSGQRPQVPPCMRRHASRYTDLEDCSYVRFLISKGIQIPRCEGLLIWATWSRTISHFNLPLCQLNCNCLNEPLCYGWYHVKSVYCPSLWCVTQLSGYLQHTLTTFSTVNSGNYFFDFVVKSVMHFPTVYSISSWCMLLKINLFLLLPFLSFQI